MAVDSQIRVVLDTNVVFEGLTKRGSISGTIIDAWFNGVITVCVTTAVIYEYLDVLNRLISLRRIRGIINTLVTLLASAEQITVYFSWRPSSTDPGDEFIIDCAMNADAVLVTSNTRDFRSAQKELGLQVYTPEQFLEFLADSLGEA